MPLEPCVEQANHGEATLRLASPIWAHSALHRQCPRPTAGTWRRGSPQSAEVSLEESLEIHGLAEACLSLLSPVLECADTHWDRSKESVSALAEDSETPYLLPSPSCLVRPATATASCWGSAPLRRSGTAAAALWTFPPARSSWCTVGEGRPAGLHRTPRSRGKNCTVQRVLLGQLIWEPLRGRAARSARDERAK